MSDLVRLDRIAALAVPPKADLLVARRAILGSLELQQLFHHACVDGWDLERLVSALEDGLSRVLGQRIGAETVRYLAQEFEARDKTQTLLVSSETGLAVAQVPPETIYQPAPVAREGTDKLATPLRRLQPEVEAAIIQHHHGQGEENRVTGALQARARSSELQRTEGDARLRIATRSGRKSLATQLLEELPALLRDHRGASGRLLKRCRVDEPVPGSHCVMLELTLFGHVRVLVADALANNFRHDAYRSVREGIRSSWARALAKAIARQAHMHPVVPVHVQAELGEGLLIADSNVSQSVRHRDKLQVPDTLAAILRGNVYLRFGSAQLDAYESEGHWNLEASVDVSMHLDPKTLCPLVFTDVVESGTSTEVLS